MSINVTNADNNPYKKRTFVIPGLSQDEYELLPTEQKEQIALVLAGEANENDDDINIIPEAHSSAITRITAEINAFAVSIMKTEGISIEQIDKQLATLDVADVQSEDVRKKVIETIGFVVTMLSVEALTNCAKHGNKDPKKQIVGSYRFDKESGMLHVDGYDEGDGFDLAEIEDPTADERLDATNGRGILCMHGLADNFEHGAQGPTGRLGSSFHAQIRLAGLDVAPNVDIDGNKTSETRLAALVKKQCKYKKAFDKKTE